MLATKIKYVKYLIINENMNTWRLQIILVQFQSFYGFQILLPWHSKVLHVCEMQFEFVKNDVKEKKYLWSISKLSLLHVLRNIEIYILFHRLICTETLYGILVRYNLLNSEVFLWASIYTNTMLLFIDVNSHLFLKGK